MALASGTRLGPYEITAQIGVGGMGEVKQRGIVTPSSRQLDSAVRRVPRRQRLAVRDVHCSRRVLRMRRA